MESDRWLVLSTKDGEAVGHVLVQSIDMFWILGRFRADRGFHKWEQSFAEVERLRLQEDDSWLDALERINGLGLRIEDGDRTTPVRDFQTSELGLVHSAQGARAEWKWDTVPLHDAEEL